MRIFTNILKYSILKAPMNAHQSHQPPTNTGDYLPLHRHTGGDDSLDQGLHILKEYITIIAA